MTGWTFQDLLQWEDPLVEHRGATVCLPCLAADLRGALCAFDFAGPCQEERHCEHCKRPGDQLFRLVARASSLGLRESVGEPA